MTGTPLNRTSAETLNTALHEAGHVVAALAFGYTVKSVTIVPKEVEGGWFVGSIDIDGHPSPRELRACGRVTAERYFIKQFAGVVAETVFSLHPHPKAWQHAADYEQGDIGYCRRWMERWAQGNLDGYQQEIRARTETFLKPRRPKVERFAGALLRHRTLDADAVRRINVVS